MRWFWQKQVGLDAVSYEDVLRRTDFRDYLSTAAVENRRHLRGYHGTLPGGWTLCGIPKSQCELVRTFWVPHSRNSCPNCDRVYDRQRAEAENI